MAEAIRRRCPSKIDIGPVYTYNPQNRLSLGGEAALISVLAEQLLQEQAHTLDHHAALTPPVTLMPACSPVSPSGA